MNDPVCLEEEDSLSRKLFERTESLLGRSHTSKKPAQGSKEGSSESPLGILHGSKHSSAPVECSPESLLGRLHSKQTKEKPCKRQKTEPSPKMQEMKSPRLKRDGSKRKTKVAEVIFGKTFMMMTLIISNFDDGDHYECNDDDLQVFSYNEMGSVVQKEAWVAPLDWAEDDLKVDDGDGGDGHGGVKDVDDHHKNEQAPKK